MNEINVSNTTTGFKSLSRKERQQQAIDMLSVQTQGLGRSDQYRPLSLNEMNDHLKKYGFEASIVWASNVRKEENQGFQKHLLDIKVPVSRFTEKKDYLNEMDLRVRSWNSFKGDMANTLMPFIYRDICSNGLYMEIQTAETQRIIHKKGVSHDGTFIERLVKGIETTIDNYNQVLDVINLFKVENVNQEFEHEYAKRILDLRLSNVSGKVIEADHSPLLVRNRSEDNTSSLWHVVNTVQENLFSWENAKECKYKFETVNKEGEDVTKERSVRRLTGAKATDRKSVV